MTDATWEEITLSKAPRFGVNYVPSQGWWYSWIDWDDAAIIKDLEAISVLGCDHIRIQCLWPLFQPNPGFVSQAMLGRLEALLNHAHAANLDVIVTVLNGWLSGMDFRPSWLDEKTNIFADPVVIRAERDLISAIADRIGRHNRFLGFDVANEPNVLSTETKNVTSRVEGDRWITELLAHCEQVAPGKFHCVGVDHSPWLMDQRPFGRATLANTGAVTPIHAWVFFTGALERYGENGRGSIHLAEYMLELAKAFQEDPAKQVWLQECGISTEWVERITPGEFVTQVLTATATVENLWGITWWCSHDIERRLHGFAELEYDLGLLTVQNEVKPMGEQFRKMVHAIAAGEVPVALRRHTALVLPEACTPDLDFADAFFRLLDQGILPAIVLEGKASDARYLETRGISTLVAFGASDPRNSLSLSHFLG